MRRVMSIPRFQLTIALAVTVLLLFQPHGRADESSAPDLSSTELLLERGRLIYTKQCIDCHGDKGQGVKDVHEESLSGDSSAGELAKLITRTMPDGEPEKCTGVDADAVAAYIHHAFYSEAARIRNRPPSIRLTHLTGTQLRQSLADLYGRFTSNMWSGSERGITASYYDGARSKKENLKIDRVDARVDFDWKHDGPGDGINPKDFFVRWRGGLKVDETGRYEIVVRSTCAFICNLGRLNREFINNRVQSGDRTEFRKSIVLTAGRVYPVQIDLYQRKRKTAQPPAQISLAWVPPAGIERVIPERCLLTALVPATFPLQTNLPPDDRSYGFERGLAIDRQWDASTTASAVEFAQIAVDELWPDYRRKHNKDSDENRARLRSFLGVLLETAFRGPLDQSTRQFYIDAQVDRTADDTEAIKRSVLVALKSPRFLYPGLDNDRTVSQRAANRLALTLFDSLPSDQWLIKLVSEDKLTTVGQVRAAATRMVGDYRVRGKTRELMHEWLNLSHIDEITKNSERFPNFKPELVSDLKASLDEFLDDVIWSESSDFRQLLLADWSYTTPRLEKYYGAACKSQDATSAELTRSVSDSAHRMGLLTHPYLMSGLAYQDSTSPVHRGVFLIRYMLGRTLRPPNEAFTPLSPDLHPDLTTRQRVALQTSPESCQVCHVKINGLGFALENFDAVGRFREQEGDRPIDSAGHYTTRDGQAVTFRGATELAAFLASSHDTHRAFVNRAFQHFVKQSVAAYGPTRLDDLTEQFRSSGYHIRSLLIEIAVVAATQPDIIPGEESSK